jgi:hypothetical protein
MSLSRNAIAALSAGVVLVVALGCTSKAEDYSGEYVFNWEVSAFYPDSSQEAWDVVGNVKTVSCPSSESIPFSSGGRAEVVFRGTLGPIGTYGHLGCCSRVLTVEQVVMVSKLKCN